MSGPFRDRARTPSTTATCLPRHCPHSKSAIPTSLRSEGCEAMRDIAPSVNAFWENQSFHNYADNAMTDAFRAGLAELRELGHALRCAVMCGSRVVAMPSTHHRGLPDCGRRDGVLYLVQGSYRADTTDRRSQAWTGRHPGLSCQRWFWVGAILRAMESISLLGSAGK